MINVIYKHNNFFLFIGTSCQISSKYEPQFSFSTPSINKSKKLSSKCTSYNVSSRHDKKELKSEINNQGNKLNMNINSDEPENRGSEKNALREKIIFFDQSEKSGNQLIPSCRKNCHSRRKNSTEGCFRRDKLESSLHKSGR